MLKVKFEKKKLNSWDRDNSTKNKLKKIILSLISKKI
jgi:hypothetical protein